MTLAEARIPGQVEDERQAYLNRTDYGMPPCGWLYWHGPWKLGVCEAALAKWLVKEENEIREEEASERRYQVLMHGLREPKPQPKLKPNLGLKPKPVWLPIEERPVPAGLMVNRQQYLWQINVLMNQWGIQSDEEFELHREKLIRWALFRMGLL